MAQFKINILEQHVEKLVAGLVGLLFLYVLLSFVAGTPNKVEVAGQMVTPGSIDEAVRGTAERVLQTIQDAKHPGVEVPDYTAQLTERIRGPYSQNKLPLIIARAVSFGLPVPVVQGPREAGRVVLAKINAPDKPEATLGRMSGFFPPRRIDYGDELTEAEVQLMELDGPTDRPWVTVAARFDLRAQEKNFSDSDYQTNKWRVLPVEVVLQRQPRLENGEWGAWEEVDEYSEYYMPAPPALIVEDEGPEGFAVPEEQRDQLIKWKEMLEENAIFIGRPPMPDPAYRTRWQPPLQGKLSDLYPDEFSPPKEVTSGAKAPRISPVKQAQKDLEQAQKLFTEDKLAEALALADKVIKNPKLPRRSKYKTQAQELREQILKRQRELEKQEIIKESTGDEATEPPLTEEIFFAHDTSGEPGTIYRYRQRLRVYNEYAMITTRLKNPQDATVVILEGEWSEPSEPVRFPPMQLVYATSARVDKNEARFDIYKWLKGEWVKSNFTTAIGEEIGEIRKVPHSQQKGNMEVDFSTDLVLVDINPTRAFVPVRYDRAGTPQVGEQEETVSAICTTPTGMLKEFILAAAKLDPIKRDIEKEMDEMKKSRKPAAPPETPREDRPPPGGAGGTGGGGGGGGRGRG
ncbi:MAG: hypothetical protein HJJLKODD_02155 [Phycisphaerae bacterium]|nr:hypothetical protein [Phycisphaerae bacterium]